MPTTFTKYETAYDGRETELEVETCTVAELIVKLQTLPQDYAMVSCSDEYGLLAFQPDDLEVHHSRKQVWA